MIELPKEIKTKLEEILKNVEVRLNAAQAICKISPRELAEARPVIGGPKQTVDISDREKYLGMIQAYEGVKAHLYSLFPELGKH